MVDITHVKTFFKFLTADLYLYKTKRVFIVSRLNQDCFADQHLTEKLCRLQTKPYSNQLQLQQHKSIILILVPLRFLDELSTPAQFTQTT